MDRWDVVFILVAGYVAVMSLVRLMAQRRNHVMNHLRGEIEQQLGKSISNPVEQESNQEGEQKTGDEAAA